MHLGLLHRNTLDIQHTIQSYDYNMNMSTMALDSWNLDLEWCWAERPEAVGSYTTIPSSSTSWKLEYQLQVLHNNRRVLGTRTR